MNRTSLLVVRLLALAAAALVLFWAWTILDNIWSYDDAGTLNYIVMAAIPGLPGLVLLAFAVHGRGPRLRADRSPFDHSR